MTEALKYPIGKFREQPYSDQQLTEWLLDIESLPSQVEFSLQNLDESQLETPYRDEGWTVKQLVHHIADSHMNAFIRFKLALTEDSPQIKPYEQDKWVKLPDVTEVPVNISVTLLFSLHRRWTELIKGIPVESWKRQVYHPEHKTHFDLWYLLGQYAWHGRHHVAHILQLRERNNW